MGFLSIYKVGHVYIWLLQMKLGHNDRNRGSLNHLGDTSGVSTVPFDLITRYNVEKNSNKMYGFHIIDTKPIIFCVVKNTLLWIFVPP